MVRLLTLIAGGMWLLSCSSSSTIQSKDTGTDVPGNGQPDETSEDTGVPDLPPADMTDLVDAGLDDIDVAGELGPACKPGDGCFLDPCDENGDCLSGWCVEHMGDKVCSQTCVEECPAGWTCKQVDGGGADVTYICVSPHARLCRPCATQSDCGTSYGVEGVCVSYAEAGSFCGSACDQDDDCPDGFVCEASLTTSGATLSLCVSAAGECTCTATSIQLGLSTPCQAANEQGTCTGLRICGPTGLTDCSAAVPAAETCNGIDDDCDGQTDEPDQVGGDFVNLCNDDNGCTQDTCNGQTGCEWVALDGGECLDGNPCTLADQCLAGVCVGNAVDCDDENPCTEDSCAAQGGCDHVPNTLPCDDQDVCTVGDICNGGECAGTPVSCDCQKDSDCATLEDGDVCNGTLICDKVKFPYKCEVASWTVITCPDSTGVNAPCLKPECDAVTGQCGLVPAGEGLPCDDGDLCNLADACVGGACQAGVEVNCNDGNPCTDDSCVPATGCSHTFNVSPCSDGNACTLDDACVQGGCVGGPAPVCDDENPCTDDSCEPAIGCVFLANALPCDDGNACTAGDTCNEGKCVFGSGVSCDDGNLCTDDSCSTLTGCVHLANNAPCSDSNACTTGDVCNGGGCLPGAAVVCNDGNPCTNDSCAPLTGCAFAPNSEPCDDGNACTAGDTCKEGKCVFGDGIDCDDDNTCTSDSCDPALGCIHKTASGPCSDGNPCTLNDECFLGSCQPGPPMDCDDANPCTADSCGGQGVCAHDPTDAACSDGNACTVGDQCQAGKCVSTGALPCDDGNLCTDDSCLPLAGCLHVNNTVPCSDGNLCTTGDVCQAGACKPLATLPCDDSSVCTADTCNPAIGCVFSPVEGPCDDGSLCTTGDLCVAGTCASGTPVDCSGVPNGCIQPVCNTKTGKCDIPKTDGVACAGNGVGECSGPDVCLSGVCDDGDLKAGLPCGAGVAQPTCDPDVCDGNGTCTNASPLPDGSLCTQGGNTCCTGTCVAGSPGPGQCDACALPPVPVLKVLVTEATTSGHTQDDTWMAALASLGHSGTLKPISFLNDANNVAGYDVLVISSGVEAISAQQQATIQGFVQSGKGVYLQSEYQTSFPSNQAFANIVKNLGGQFTWTGTVSGQLSPVTIEGCWAKYPNAVATYDYFWYACEATPNSPGLSTVISKNGHALAFSYCVQAPTRGLILTTSDQDFLMNGTASVRTKLLQNFLARLAWAKQCK